MEDLRVDRRPLYTQVYERLVTLITEQLEPGDQLPSENELAARLGVSRATLREALRILEEEGAIVRRQGVGTFVTAGEHLESGLERLESVLALAARQGLETRVRDLAIDVVEAERTLAEALQVERASPLTRVCRTVLVAGRPVAYLEDFVPARWLKPADVDEASFEGSVLDFLNRHCELHIQEALADITAVRAGRAMARRLDVHPGAALILLKETLFDVEGTPVGFSRNYFVPDRFRFHVVRR
jgi:GntR family transcriptional regulator